MSNQILGMGGSISMGGDISNSPTNQASPAPAVTGDIIKDADTQSFMADVIDASKQVPVLVDFWAPWCGPCKQLGPLLEKLVMEARGAIRLVKINLDENQAIAAQLRVQSIPAVFAFVNGQPVDGFMGAVPEKELREFIARILGGKQSADIEPILKQARELLTNGELEAAAQSFVAVLHHDRENIAAITGLARCQLESGDIEAAQTTLSLVPPSKENDQDVKNVKAAIELAANPIDESEVAELLQKVTDNPDDHQTRLELAEAQNRASQREQAIDSLLHIIRVDREWNEQAARIKLLEFFETWGMTDPATIAGRRKLSALLFS